MPGDQIWSAKKIFGSLHENSNTSIYHPLNTKGELAGKLTMVESIMNAQPILISNKSSDLQLPQDVVVNFPLPSPV